MHQLSTGKELMISDATRVGLFAIVNRRNMLETAFTSKSTVFTKIVESDFLLAKFLTLSFSSSPVGRFFQIPKLLASQTKLA